MRAITAPTETLHDDVIGKLMLLQVVIHLSITYCALRSRLVNTTDRRIYSHGCNMLFCRERAKLLGIGLLNTILSVMDRVTSLNVLSTCSVSNVGACATFLNQSRLVIQIAAQSGLLRLLIGCCLLINNGLSGDAADSSLHPHSTSLFVLLLLVVTKR